MKCVWGFWNFRLVFAFTRRHHHHSPSVVDTEIYESSLSDLTHPPTPIRERVRNYECLVWLRRRNPFVSDKIFHMSGNLIFIRLRVDTMLDSCGDASTLIRVMKIAFLLAQPETSSAINKMRRRSCKLPAQKSPPGNCKIEKLKRERPHKFPNYNFRFSFMLFSFIVVNISMQIERKFSEKLSKKSLQKGNWNFAKKLYEVIVARIFNFHLLRLLPRHEFS